MTELLPCCHVASDVTTREFGSGSRVEMEAAIQQIHDYLAKVDGLLDKTVYIKARAQQYEVVVQHIKARLPVDCEMAAKLIELVASGPWDADQKENIMLVINGGMSGGTSRALRPRQNCTLSHFR